MSTVIARDYYSVPAVTPARAEILPFPLSQPAGEVSLQITVPDFDFSLAAPLIDLTPEIESGVAIIKAAVDSEAMAVLTLAGKLIDDEAKFQPEQASLAMELAKERARADFVASTLMAVTGLADRVHVQIPELQLDLELCFDPPLKSVSLMLQRRQVAYRLMVIEKATGYEFVLPPDLSAGEVNKVAFVYNAIVHPSFVWPIESYTDSFPATKELFNRLTTLSQPGSIRFEKQGSETLLGRLVPLGHATMTIEDGVIEDFDAVQEELARGDNHEVPITVRSLKGQARLEFPEAPRLPDPPWDPQIQELIDLEPQLDARLAEHCHALAAASLADLTEEEIKEITARPEIMGEPFLLSMLRKVRVLLSPFRWLYESLLWRRVKQQKLSSNQ